MKRTTKTLIQLPLGLALAAFSQYAASGQIVLDPAWRVTPDTNKVGFKWSYFQNNANTANSTARAEAALAGLLTDSSGAPLPNLGDPNTVGAAIAPSAPANPDNGLLYFEITNVINLNKNDGGNAGNFTSDNGFPDQLEPGLNGNISSDGQSAEIMTYVTFPAGVITLGVNSDDGFQSSSGANPSDIFNRVVLGEFNGGRGASDTWFTFVVSQAGTYPLRTVWENGGGDSNVELFQVITNSTSTNRILINDVASGGLPAYRALTGASSENPYIKVVTPLPIPRQGERVSSGVSIVLADGATQVDEGSVSLTIDGTAAPVTPKRTGNTVSLDTGVLPGFHAPAEGHLASLTYKNKGGTFTRTQSWTFYNIQNLVLPAKPITGENFDAYPEATDAAHAAPPGWTLSNYSWLETGASGFGSNGGAVWDLTTQANDPYLNWCMIDTNTAFNMEAQVLDNDKTQTINGVPVTDSWMSGNCLFLASDGRARHVSVGGENQADYAPQIQIVVTAPFDLSSVTNPVLTFSSAVRISGNGEEDALEYSVDNGTNWLPGIMMFNANRLFTKPDGSYDAMLILTNVWADVAKFPVVQDPNTRDWISSGPKGQKFGDVLLAPLSPAMASHIVERNDTAVARRVEALRLPEASKKSAVRLRFVHYGSCGWEWALDNIAFYDIAPTGTPAPTNPVITSATVSGGSITIKWSNGGTLESAPTVGGTPIWTSTGNSTGTFTEPIAAGNKFYRVKL